MARANQHYKDVQNNYLFSEIARKVAAYTAEHPDKQIIRMGIGDVTLPLCRAAVDAMKAAAEEMGHSETFRGYGPEQGYPFLKSAIAGYYSSFNVRLSENEIFVSDGAKSDIGNITDIFSGENRILIPDPVYPVYVDSNLMLGRQIVFIDGCEENGFLPIPDDNIKADIIYLCSPNNPTGAVYDKAALTAWVDYANKNDAVILFDAAYESFISDPALPRSIYQIEEARNCAIEFCSFSKTAGFTGTRCGYTVIPEKLELNGMSLNKMWLRRQTTKFNGVSYIVQRGAEAVLTTDGLKQARENIAYYMDNAAMIAKTLSGKAIKYVGGVNSPYIWMKCPDGLDSWAFFDYLLKTAGVVGTPGAGFGKNGEGWFRLTAFGSKENTAKAMRLLDRIL